MCLIWGLPYLLIKIAVRDLTPGTLVWTRTAFAAVLLLPLAASKGQLRPLLAYWKPLLAYTAVEIAVPWYLLSNAELKLSSSLSGLLIAATPLVGVVLARVAGSGEQMGPMQIAGLLLGLAGVGALVGFDVHASDVTALLTMGVVVTCYVGGPQIIRRYLADAPPLGVVTSSLALAAIAYTPVAILQWPHRVPTTSVFSSLAVLVVVCTALAFLLFFALIAEVGPVRATVITYLNPAVALLLGISILGEKFTAGIGIGFVLTLAGSALATRRPAAMPEEVVPAGVSGA